MTRNYVSDALYNGRHHVSADDVLAALAQIDARSTSLLVVAHNPTVHELLAALVGREVPLLRRGYSLGAAYVLEIGESGPRDVERYPVVASFIPD